MNDASLPTIKQLRQEAVNLERVLRLATADRLFLEENPANRIVYFLDAHELKGYIDPNRITVGNAPGERNTGDGFMLDVEKLKFQQEWKKRTDELKLRNDQILRHLLIDGDFQVGLLPSHGEEMDEEIEFQLARYATDQIGLVEQARMQVQQARQSERWRRLQPILSEAVVGTTDHRAGLLSFFRDHAPALLALLRRNPDSPRARVDQILEKSNLVVLEDLDWVSCGLTPDMAERMASPPPADRVTAWQNHLASIRPRSSQRSNRIDGQALAYIEAMNRKLREAQEPCLRVRLVTRAWTLIARARHRHRLNALLHPRLISPSAVQRHPGTQGSSGDRAQKTRLERALAEALHTFHSQLSVAAGGYVEGQPAGASLRDAADILFAAWDEFERANFAIGLHASPDRQQGGDSRDTAVVDGMLKQALDWFRTDADIVKLVQTQFSKSLDEFREATFKLGSGSGKPVGAVIERPPHGGGGWLFPITGEFIGPTRLRRADGVKACWMAELGTLSDRAGLGAAERYLVWCLRLAGEGSPRLAEVYALGAEKEARLAVPPDEEVVREAKLLQARLQRITLPSDDPAARQRRWRHWHKSFDHDQPAGDPRVACERSLFDLELLLSLDGKDLRDMRDDAPRLEAVAHRIVGLADRCPGRVLPAWCLALGLVCELAALQRGEPAFKDFGQAAHVHQRLHGLLRDLREHEPGLILPPLLRAVELIGFQRFRSAGDDDGPASGEFDATGGLNIPAELRLDTLAVLRSLAHDGVVPGPGQAVWNGGSALADFVTRELGRVWHRLSQSESRDLVYAPVWAPYAADEIIDGISDGGARELARAAYALLIPMTGGTQRYGVHEEDRATLTQVRKTMKEAVDRFIPIAPGDRPNQRAAFVLRMEVRYCDLLLAQLATGDERITMLRRLADAYDRISQDFPQASIPHFRRNVVIEDHCAILSRAGNDALAATLKKEALVCLDRAIALWPGDPYRPAGRHWVFSTMIRRRAVNIGRSIEQSRPVPPPGPGGSTQSGASECLMSALKILQDNYWELRDDDDFLFRLEHRRLVNNIVFYACLIRQNDPEWRCLSTYGIDEDGLRRRLAFLHPKGIELVREPNIVHTIGFAHHVLGDHIEAGKVGEYLVKLLTTTTAVPDAEKMELFDDASIWIRRAAEVAVGD